MARSRAGASFSMIGVCHTRPVKYFSGAMAVGTLPQAMIFIVASPQADGGSVGDGRSFLPQEAGTFVR
ncbi:MULTISPECIES: hypothetical protein [unclassified Mesorhizobium]|nr:MULTISPECIES: hypothetical protein [unclassified Mesorhizobium]